MGGETNAKAWEAAKNDPFFAIECLDANEACVIRGRITKKTQVVAGESGGNATRAYAVELETESFDDTTCAAPSKASAMHTSVVIDKTAKTRTEYERATKNGKHLRISGAIAPHLEQALTVGSALCGYAIGVQEPGGPPGSAWAPRTEGALYDREGVVLAAWSNYFVRAESTFLGKHWSFAREGTPAVEVSEEARWLLHPRVKVTFDGTSRLVLRDAEDIIRTPQGELHVRVASLLTTRAHAYVGDWNGYRFSAVR